MKKVVVSISLLLQFSIAIYRNHPIDFRCKSVDCFLYNGNPGLNGKVDALVKANVNL